jgi:hypothetical protein
MANKNTALMIGLGIGALYLLTKSTTAVTYPAGFIGPIQPGSASPAGSLVGGLSNIISGLFKTTPSTVVTNVPTATPSNPTVNNGINYSTAPTPQGTLTCAPNGNVCDPNDCDYNADVCTEMGG